jgi:hypothetical protein
MLFWKWFTIWNAASQARQGCQTTPIRSESNKGIALRGKTGLIGINDQKECLIYKSDGKPNTEKVKLPPFVYPNDNAGWYWNNIIE